MTQPTPDPLAVTGQRPYRSRHGITRWSGPRPVDLPITPRSKTLTTVDTCTTCKRALVPFTTWFQYTPEQRAEIRRTHARMYSRTTCTSCDQRARRGGGAKRFVAQCGTRSGCNAHRRRGETPCDPCREAERADKRARLAAKKIGA